MVEKSLGEGALKGDFMAAIDDSDGEVMHLISFRVKIGKGGARAGLQAGSEILLTMARPSIYHDFEVGYVRISPPKVHLFPDCNRKEIMDTSYRLERHLIQPHVLRALDAIHETLEEARQQPQQPTAKPTRAASKATTGKATTVAKSRRKVA